ncbi:unnamed protein product [Tilletia controversa]|uniref:Uncharacterized protein n=2 Tax=Tilletia TaxID=13289 RepID=A0A8X7MR96_9BASI|nr:hypothetical protein CF328_g4690 [Tilletia controversa]KAE8196027.1 hypothetical protein CF336_g2807 [Tilletia laevis]KAE8264182.1 hypothetical protein A4X03_0g1123 [Tilletia caries]KAE8245910.1 hypothetical protein A4X06_0g5333 [Tilletia controversa]CAD6888508.1 unnamed protein product [Tilletia caries]
MRSLFLPVVFLFFLGSHAVPVVHMPASSALGNRDVARLGPGIVPSEDGFELAPPLLSAASRDFDTASAAVSYPAGQLAARELSYAAGNGLSFVGRTSLDEAGDFLDGFYSNPAPLGDVLESRHTSYDLAPDATLTPHLKSQIRALEQDLLAGMLESRYAPYELAPDATLTPHLKTQLRGLDEADNFLDNNVPLDDGLLADSIESRQASHDLAPDVTLTPHLQSEIRAPSSLPTHDEHTIHEVRRAIEAMISEPEAENLNEERDIDELHEAYDAEEEVEGELLGKRIVYNPTITYPRRDTVWKAGDQVHVNWRTADIPKAYRSHRGSIMLGYRPSNGEGGLNLHRTLASRFPIMAGSMSFTLPDNLPTRNDYIVVLFGDSGNASPLFTIRGRQNELVQMLGVDTASEYQDGLVRPLSYKAKQPEASKPVGPGAEGDTLEGIMKSSSNGLLI